MIPDWTVLAGVLVVLGGFLLRLDTLAVVVAAGLAAGILGGLAGAEGLAGAPLERTLGVLGRGFVENRYMSLYLLAFPMIALLERHGLREKAAELMARARGLSPGRVVILYHLVREVAAALSVRLGGHAPFVRPLVHPMARSAAAARFGELDEEGEERIKGAAAAAENYGNFFGQNVFVASRGVLLIVSSLEGKGVLVAPLAVALNSIPVAVVSFGLATLFNLLLDRRLGRRAREGGHG